MAEYIEREAAIRAALIADCEDVSLNEAIKVTGEVAEAIKRVPAADVAPVRHGKWVEKHYGGNLYAHVCSECGAKRNVLTYGYKFNYCSSCGAKMDADEKRMINEPSGVL